MASIPFTLAALSTSAVPGLTVFGVREHESDDAFVSAVVITEDAELLVRVPRTHQAEVQQSAELLGLAALTDGPRSRLPFDVPSALGMTRAGDTRAVVTTHLDGARFSAEELSHDAILLEPIAETIAAIHELPITVAHNGGLPVRSAQDLRLIATRLVDRADATRLLPETVRRRWTHVLETAELWDFTPTLVHGSLDADQLRVTDDRISAVLGWSEFAVGDPATDLAWLLAAGSEVLDGVIARYSRARNAESLPHLRARASLYHELEVARWLLHGTETHDQAVIDDAVTMLDRLVGTGGALGAAFTAAVSASPLNSDEVIALLSQTPEVESASTDTAAYEALDEDRMFGFDTDFIEPLEADQDGKASTSADSDGSESSAKPSAPSNPQADLDPDGVTDVLEPLDSDSDGITDVLEPLDSKDRGTGSETSRGASAPGSPSSPLAEDELFTEPIDDQDLPREHR
ncbi:phosphotransferase [Leucobacter sp. USHLN153]|uniref:phosphotransferase n=1 Tax=Leucobacter sp. USHLN153 TaxID=3081268 RepID=UPI0030170BE4